MRAFFVSLGIMTIFAYIIYHFYVDVMNYKNSYTLADGGVFAEGMQNANNQQYQQRNRAKNVDIGFCQEPDNIRCIQTQ